MSLLRSANRAVREDLDYRPATKLHNKEANDFNGRKNELKNDGTVRR